VRTCCQVLTARRPAGAALACVCLAVAMFASATPASARIAAGRDDYARASLQAVGLTLDSREGLVESTTPSDLGAGLSASDPPSEAKNPMVAMLMSVVLPGWGELYTGNTARAKGFMTAEAGIWVGYAAFKIQQGMRIEDYEEYAEVFADVPEGSDGDYYQDIADYIRNEGEDSYNEAIRAEARSLYPDDLQAQHDYVDQNGYFGAASWEWDNEARFEHYRDLRHDAGVSRKNAFYMTGLAVLNRALSAIDSAWMARRHNQGLEDDLAARVILTPDVSEDSVGGRVAVEFSF